MDNVDCPICGLYVFDHVGDFDICDTCFWENDEVQHEDPDYPGGANHLSQNDYRKWWTNVDSVIPMLMEKYGIIKEYTLTSWKYAGLSIPRENIVKFVNEATEHRIELQLDFYNICNRYGFDYWKFIGYPTMEAASIKENNDKLIDVVFTKNPIATCTKHHLKHVRLLLRKSKDPKKFWIKNPPCITVIANPSRI